MRISIVTPSLNQGAYIGECIASVLTASNSIAPHEIEHIVCDGGSTDATLDILRASPHVHWISEPDNGQSHAINKGLSQASGEILTYLCADDLYEPDTLRAVISAFENNQRADVIYSDFYFLEGASGRKRRKSAAKFSPQHIRNYNPLGQPAVWWRRQVYDRFGGFDESLHFCMDHEYWIRLGQHVHWHYLPEPLAICRLHADAKTSSQLPAMWKETAKMLNRDGWHFRPWWNAMNMSIWGKHYYRLKRLWFSR